MGQHGLDALAGDVLRQVAPVRADVGHGRTLALAGVEPPRVVGVFEQPVLQIGALHQVHGAGLARRHHGAGLLHERIAAVVEGHGVHHPGRACGVAQPARVGRGGRERFVAHDVFAVRERGVDDRPVQRVGRRDVYHVHVGVGGERREAAVGLGHAERTRLGLGRGVAAGRHGHDVDEAEPAHRIDVMGADEAGAHEAHADPAAHAPSAFRA